tara:strand:+ start:372 stop:479 length:108 start_codon:yes stop_codon:yes gene_type:complete
MGFVLERMPNDKGVAPALSGLAVEQIGDILTLEWM